MEAERDGEDQESVESQKTQRACFQEGGLSKNSLAPLVMSEGVAMTH